MQIDKEVTERVAWLRTQSVEFRKEWLANLRTEKGGYTKNALASIGIPWPPPRKWGKRFVAGDCIPNKDDVVRRERKTAKKQRRSKRRKLNRLAEKPRDKFLASYEWRRLRYEVLQRYGARCMACGRTPSDGAVMNVDHIKCRKLHPELALDEDNLQVLCHECNHGKGNWDDTDWRQSS